MKTEIQYYHRIVVVVLVSTSFAIALGLRLQKNGEAEFSCAVALLQIWSGSWAAASWMCWWWMLCVCQRPSSGHWSG